LQRWSGHFEVSSADPLPTVLVILGFIATFFIGIPLLYFDKPIGLWVIIFGIFLIGVGLYFWMIERQQY